MDKKQSVKNNFIKFIFIITLILILYSIIFFIVFQKPYYVSEKNKIFKAVTSNFDFKTESVYNYFNLLNDEGILVTSRTKIREQLILYNEKKVDFQNLKNYTKPKLDDVIHFSENIVSIVRFTLDKKYIISGKEFEKNYWIYPQNNNKSIFHGFIFVQNNHYFYNILFPIIDPEKGLNGYDLIFYKIDYLINSIDGNTTLNKNTFDNIEYNIKFISRIKDNYYSIPGLNKITDLHLIKKIDNIYKYKPNRRIILYDNKNIFILKILNPYNIILSFKINQVELYRALILYFKRSIISFIVLILIIIIILYLFSRPFFDKYFITITELENKINEKNRELIREKKIFEQYLDITPVIIVVLDKYGYIEYINETGLKLLEYNHEEIIGKNWFENFIPENEKEKIIEVFNKILKGEVESVKKYINTIKTKSDDILLIEWQNRYFKDNNGNVIGTYSVGINVTETKNKEKQIEMILSSIKAFVWMGEFDEKGRFTPLYYSKGVENITGYTTEEIVSGECPWRKIVLEEDIYIINKSREKMFRLEKGVEEYRIKTKNGEILWMKSWYYPLRKNKKIIINGFCYDITHEKELEKWFKTIVDTLSKLNIGYIIYSATNVKDSKIIDVNQAFERLTRYKREEIINKRNPLSFISKPYRKLVEERFKKRISNQDVSNHYEIEVLRKDGTTFIADLNITFITIRGKRYVFSLFMDVTEKAKREQNMLVKQKLEAIGILASGIAHDFNNILGGIFGWVSLLENLVTDEEQLKMIKEIRKAGNRAADLISKLLGFARKGKYENKILNLNGIVEDVLSIINPSIKKNIKINTNLQNNIYLIEGDPNQLQQTIMNLCVNAIQAMPSGGILTISTNNFIVDKKFASTHFNILPGNYVQLIVEDTGIGIDKETLTHIFEPFFTTKKEGKGTGLGLSTVYGIVKNHGGIITVYSEPGKGTSFKIYLPASDKPEISTVMEQEDNKLIKGKGNILIIDDEEMIRSVYSKMLNLLGYDVLSANNGFEGIKIFEENKSEIDVVILDLNMPEMDGEVAFEKLKFIKPEIKIILATGFAINGTVQMLLDKGADGYIKKPFTIQELSDILEKVLKKNEKN